jgi:hypothetical protein
VVRRASPRPIRARHSHSTSRECVLAAVSISLNSRFPISLWWGPELVMFYNDAWRPTLGKTKHPAGLGRPGIESWPEVSEDLDCRSRP